MNELNLSYKYAKFVIDPNDGAVSAMFDFPEAVSDKLIGNTAREILTRFFPLSITLSENHEAYSGLFNPDR
jgi:hypothetical protein